MKSKANLRAILSLLVVLPPLLLAVFQPASASEGKESLVARLASLQLGMNGYVVGTRLTGEKKEYSASNLIDDAYPGTYKFRDNDLLVVAARQDDTVLALYQRYENTDIDQARKMISGLMGLFGEPTAMAHDQLIYWAYNEQGKISEEEYLQLRDKGEKFSVLATVKLNSTLAITAEDPEKGQQGTVYFIISSDPLLQEFMSR